MTTLVYRRPHIFLLVLLLFHLILLSIQARDSEGRRLVQAWGLWLATPIAVGLDGVVSTATTFASRYAFVRKAARENEQLKIENARLELEVQRLSGALAMAHRTVDYPALQRQLEFSSVAASLNWRGGPVFEGLTVISAGSRDGVAADAAVFTPGGIVGRVIATTPFSSEVQLITDPEAAAGVVVADSRIKGVVEGTGSGLLKLNYVANSAEVPVGSVVMTSGSDRIYPKGLLVGTVVRSEPGPVMYRDIVVEPLQNLLRIEEVLVLMGPERPAAPTEIEDPVP